MQLWSTTFSFLKGPTRKSHWNVFPSPPGGTAKLCTLVRDFVGITLCFESVLVVHIRGTSLIQNSQFTRSLSLNACTTSFDLFERFRSCFAFAEYTMWPSLFSDCTLLRRNSFEINFLDFCRLFEEPFPLTWTSDGKLCGGGVMGCSVPTVEPVSGAPVDGNALIEIWMVRSEMSAKTWTERMHTLSWKDDLASSPLESPVDRIVTSMVNVWVVYQGNNLSNTFRL